MTAPLPGISAGRNRQSCVWLLKVAFTGTVLDAGSGTGENALHLASLGLPVLAI